MIDASLIRSLRGGDRRKMRGKGSSLMAIRDAVRKSGVNISHETVRPVPHLAEGWLKPKDQVRVLQWAALNERALVDYWEGRISTREFQARRQRLPP